MTVLICETLNKTNEYVEFLAEAYQRKGCQVYYGVQNFLYSNLIPDLVHIQWPEAIYSWREKLPKTESTARFVGERLAYFRNRGATVTYTVHNLMPHDSVEQVDKDIYQSVLEQADIVVHHGETSRRLLSDATEDHQRSDQPLHIQCPHGPYKYSHFPADEARSRYALPNEKWIVLNFGRQRAYKGQSFTESVFNYLDRGRFHLFTAGAQSSARSSLGSILKRKVKTRLRKVSGGGKAPIVKRSRRHTSYDRRVPREEVPSIMAASDIVFLGHQRGLNSGVLALAATYGKPVVFPRLGNFEEQLKGYEWYEPYDTGSVVDAASAIKRLEARLANIGPGNLQLDNSAWLRTHSWDIHVQRIIDAAQSRQNRLNRR